MIYHIVSFFALVTLVFCGQSDKRGITQVSAGVPVPALYQDFMRTLLNYAAWDASVALLQDPTPGNVATYIDENLVYQAMFNLPLNYVGYYFPNGSSLFTIGYDFQTANPTRQVAMPAPFVKVDNDLITGSNQSVGYRYTSSYKGADGRTILIVGAPIMDGTFTGATYGFALFGIYQNLLPSPGRYFMDLLINFSSWDGSVELMEYHDPANLTLFYQTTLNATNIALIPNNLINFISYYFPNGTILISVGYSFEKVDPVLIPLPDFMENVPQQIVTLMSNQYARFNGTVPYTDGRTVTVVGACILTTDGQGPCRGFLMFGRLSSQVAPVASPTTTVAGQPPIFRSSASTYSYSLLCIVLATLFI